MKKKNFIFAQGPDYKKKYRRLQVLTILLFVFSAGLVYINYDYLVFKFLISYNYAYTDVLDELYEDTIGEDNIKSYFSSFDSTVISVYTAKLREISGDRYTYLYTPAQYTFSKEYTKLEAEEALIEEVSGNAVYMNIPNISKYTKDFVYNNSSQLETYDNIIIDLRNNSGGRLDAMYKTADLFLEKGSIIGSEKTRSSLTSSTAKAKKKQMLNFENIFILVNENTASAAEGFTMALKENLNNVTVVGTKTFGKGIGQITMPIKRGFAVKATIMETRTPQDNTINRIGITPDIEYTKDDIKEYILTLIS